MAFLGKTYARCERGAVAVEFAMVGPLLIMMLAGIISYGGYFWMAHAVQQVANDAARVAIAGLDANERASLARALTDEQIADYAYLDPSAAAVALDDRDGNLKISVSYDASHSPFWLFGQLLPMPSSTITRQAVVRLGGY